jgi:hypothetical protein
MALNINLEDVPNEIFEVVKARILKNRKSRTQAKAPKPKPALKPLPQFKKVGADTKQWRRPEYAVAKKGSFPVLIQEHLSEFYFDILDQSRTFVKEENYLFASKILSGTIFEVYRLYRPWIYGIPPGGFKLPPSSQTIVNPQIANSKPILSQSNFEEDAISCKIIKTTGNSITLNVKGKVRSTGAPGNQVVTTTTTGFLEDSPLDGWLVPDSSWTMEFGGVFRSYKWVGRDTINSTYSQRDIFYPYAPSNPHGRWLHTESITNNVKPPASSFPEQKFYVQIGLFFEQSTLSVPTYFYIFSRKDSAQSEPQHFLDPELDDRCKKISEISPTSYPPSSINPGFVRKITITPEQKTQMLNQFTDIYNNTVAQRTFETGKVGNFTLFNNYGNSSAKGSFAAGYDSATSSTQTGALIEKVGSQVIVSTTTFTPAAPVECDETIEIIRTEIDYGPLQ